MSKTIKNSSIIVIAVLVVVAAGFLTYVQITEESTKESVPVAEQVNPETQADVQVQQAGRNYVDSEIVDNRYTRSIYMGNVTYLADDDTYQPIDTALVESDSDYNYENITNVFESYFKEDATADDLIKFQIGDRAVSFSFVDANESSPVSKDNTITYPDVYDGLDAVYTISGNELLEELVAEKELTIEKVSQKLKLTGVYYKDQPDGSIIFHDIETKNIVWSIPAPVMYEKEDSTKRNYGLHYEISKSDDGYIISKVIDAAGKAWLKNANYPLVIDATIIPFFNTDERNLELTFSDNGGFWQSAETVYTHRAGIGFRTFLTFNTSSLGQATVDSATLVVYMYKHPSTYTREAHFYSGADLYDSPSNAYNSISSAYREANFDIMGIPWLESGCTPNWDNCKRELDVNTASVSQSGRTQFVLPESDMVGWNNDAYIAPFSSRHAYGPELRVTVVLDAPDLTIADPTVPGQLEVTLNDNSDDEDWWIVQRSLNGTSGWANICSMETGLAGVCIGGTYDCSATSGPTYGTESCTFTNNGLGGNTRYYYRAYAYREQDI